MSGLFKENETLPHTLNGLTPDVIISSSIQNPFELKSASANFTAMTGYSHKSLLNKTINFTFIIYGEDLKLFEKQYKKAITSPEKVSRLNDFRLVNKNNTLIHVRAFVYRTDDIVILQLSDVSEYFQKLEENDNIINRYKKLMITLNEGIWDWNIKTNNVFFSDKWLDMLDYSEGDFPGTFESWKKNVHPDDLGNALDAIEKHLNDGTPIYEKTYRLRKKDGSYIWVHDKGIKQLNEKGEAIRMIGSHRNITDEKENREKLEKMIITDELTSLFNRRHYDSQIGDEILRAERYNGELSILMIDIDLFKQINDTYGHRAGDIALKELSAVIKKKIRNTDSAFRTGGEEFMVIAPETNEENAMKAAERLRKAVSEINIETKYGSFNFTISLGVTTFRKGDTYTTLNERADIALYKSKDSGRNCSYSC